MSNLKVYSIKDTKIGSYGTPFFKEHEMQAIRDFHRLAQDKNSHIRQYPADFQLWQLGELNSDNGQIKSEVKFISDAPTDSTETPG